VQERPTTTTSVVIGNKPFKTRTKVMSMKKAA
jgi:hypothetical protein